MKRKLNLRWLLLIAIIAMIALLNGNSVHASYSNEITKINPVYEHVLSKKEKEEGLEKLKSGGETKSNYHAYNTTLYTNYNDLVKAIQGELLKRNGDFIYAYKTNGNFDIEKSILDAMSEKYAGSSPELGDYLRWSVYGYAARWNIQVSGSYKTYIIEYKTIYFASYEQEQELTKAVKNYLSTYPSKNKSAFQMYYDFNEYICKNTKYDYNYNIISHSAYAAMINHSAVCQGYATLYYRLLKECGLNVRIIVSEEINHAWNAVYYKGKWYMIDTTWNDSDYGYYNTYFMESPKEFRGSHSCSLTDIRPSLSELNYATERFKFTDISQATGEVETLVEDIISKNAKPEIDLTYNGETLVENQDYEIINVEKLGEEVARVTIKGIYRFTGIKEFLVKTRTDLSDYEVAEIPNYMYTGKNIIPKVNVTDKQGNVLIEGTDYKVIGSNNINKGIATAIIKGKGEYCGSISTTFNIISRPISQCTILNIANQAYTGKEIKPNVTIKNGGIILKNGVDYTVTYKNNINLGKNVATAYIIGKGNYEGSIFKKFNIIVPNVTGLYANKQSQSTITVKWSKPAGAIYGYEVYMATSKSGKYTKIATINSGNTISYKKTKLSAGKVYYFKVRAFTKVGSSKKYGEYSKILSTSTKTKTPKISKLSAGKRSITVKWNKISGATGYEVYMATSKSGKYTKIVNITKGSKISYKKTGLKKGKRYYFKVRTYKTVDGKKIYGDYSSKKSVVAK